MQNDVLTVAKGHAPILPATATATGIVGFFLKYLEVVNSTANLIMVLIGIGGGCMLYKKYKAEALRADAETEKIHLENEQMRLNNEQQRVMLEAQEIEQRLEKSTVKLIEKISERINEKNSFLGK